jgi:hypothetical protein
MASTLSGSHQERRAANGEPPSGALERMSHAARILVGLIAVYAPPVVVLQLHHKPLASVYLVLAIWAIEGLVWYWLEGRVARRP